MTDKETLKKLVLGTAQFDPNYGFDAAKENFKNADCDYVSLSDYDNMLTEALNTKYITERELPLLIEWRKDPSAWKK